MTVDPKYRFFSSVRRGVAAHVDEPDLLDDSGPSRVEVSVDVIFDVNVDEPPEQRTASIDLPLLGPGEITGFDERAVIRVWPPRDTRDAEPNYFPLIEFDQVDLPWRYTPRSANADGRLRPWLCLIVLKDSDEEIGGYEPSNGQRSLGKVTVRGGAPLPRLDQVYAWAHVQVTGFEEGESLNTVVTEQSERCVARLLCPRRLEPRTQYWAMLVPTFELGALAGLRLPTESPTDLAPAWTEETTEDFELPVYYRWHFGTGDDGDFESLVRSLKAQPLPAEVGTRTLDVRAPGGELPSPAAAPVVLGGALQPPDALPWAWPTGADASEDRENFIDALAALLNLPDDRFNGIGGDAVVAPPLYGMWHARRWRVADEAPGEVDPSWFDELNQDPRTRIAAALGTEVVQVLQNELMESAWSQLSGIRDANDQLRKAQLARAIAQRLHLRFVQPATADGLLQFTGNALKHILHATNTAHALVRDSPPGLALVGGALRRLFRPLGPVGRRQLRPNATPASIISSINDGDYNEILFEAPPAIWVSNANEYVPTYGWLKEIADLAAFPPVEHDPSTTGDISDQDPSGAPAWDPEYTGDVPEDEETPWTSDSASMAAFREAAIAFAGRSIAPDGGGTRVQLDLAAIQTTVVGAVDPRVSLAAALGRRLKLRPDFGWEPPDPLEAVMAHPEFPHPMYAPLAELSQEWILPGLSAMEANSVGLATTNQAFIEAYMIGLNHEMARELLWREYPTDQRGTYFQQFWDPRGLSTTPTPENAKDITAFEEWASNSELGSHSPREGASDGSHLVLVVRGEVLRRYPGTLVYAQRADGSTDEWTLATPAELRKPVFRGRLKPDVAFFGFDLTKVEARGDETDPGWFFVFEEQPGEPKFGLDEGADEPPTDWDELAWSHVADAIVDGYIDLSVDLEEDIHDLEEATGAGWHVDRFDDPPNLSIPIARGADHARITHQRPVRVAMHASKLLPSEG